MAWSKKNQICSTLVSLKEETVGRKQVSLTVPQSPNKLRLGEKSNDEPIRIPIRKPVELDFLPKEEVMRLRQEAVNQYAFLVSGAYTPWQNVFGSIGDRKPWWGLKGQYCNGSGQKSIEGESEESRFLLNPFVLLAIDEVETYQFSGNCQPVYLLAESLQWMPSESKAVVTYNISHYFQQKEAQGLEPKKIVLSLDNMNARDFGFNFAAVCRQDSRGITSPQQEQLFAVNRLDGFLHLGGSCGYPGGCNNSSPYEPEFNFKVVFLPGEIYCELWYKQPKDVKQKADFIYIIKFY